MKVALTFPSKHEERIRKALGEGGTIEEQMVKIVLAHVGNTEIQGFRQKLDQTNQEKIQAQAQQVSRELGL